MGGIDLSPLVLIVGLQVVSIVLSSLQASLLGSALLAGATETVDRLALCTASAGWRCNVASTRAIFWHSSRRSRR